MKQPGAPQTGAALIHSSGEDSKSGISRMDCLDGLRGMAALWVLLGHCVILSGWSFAVIDKPDLGVDLFMMLSGFLMVFQYRLRAKRESWADFGTWMKFWARRFFRIAPLYYLILAICLACGPAILAWRTVLDNFAHVPPQAVESYTDASVTNILAHLTFIFSLLPNYVLRTPLPDWSLGLEMQFYLVFPLLMILMRRFGWIASTVAICLAAAVATHATWHFSIHYPLPSLLPFKIGIFLAGMLLAEACDRGRRPAGLYFFLALVLALEPYQGEGSLMRTLIRELLVTVFFGLVLARHLPAPLKAAMGRLAAILGNNPFRWMGDVSYSVYLLHMPIMAPIGAFLANHYGHRLSAGTRCAMMFAAVSAIVYPLAWLTYRWVEIPGQTMGRSFIQSLSGKSNPTEADRADGLAAP